MLPNIPPNPAADRIIERAAPQGIPSAQTQVALTSCGDDLHNFGWLRHYDALHDRAVGVLQDVASRAAGFGSIYELRQAENMSPGGAPLRHARRDARAVQLELNPAQRAVLEEHVDQVLTANELHDLQRALGDFCWHALAAMGDTRHGVFVTWFIARSMLAARRIEAPVLTPTFMAEHGDYSAAEWFFLIDALLPAHAAPLPLRLLARENSSQRLQAPLPALPETVLDEAGSDEASRHTPSHSPR